MIWMKGCFGSLFYCFESVEMLLNLRLIFRDG